MSTPSWMAALRERISYRHVDLDALLHSVVDHVRMGLDADRGTLYLVDHARGELVSRVANLPELREIRLRVGEGVAGWVAAHARVLNVPRGTDDPRFAGRIDAVTGYRTHSLLAAPALGPDGEVIAVLQLLNKREGVFTEADEGHLRAIAVDFAELLATTSLGSQLQPDQRLPLAFHYNHLVGESEPMLAVYERAARAAATEATVLVRGETGTGKELVARAIHDNSARRDGPFVTVDCAALPEHLVENELFGHVRGGYTGADQDAPGKVHAAAGGTLFLDEVGELPIGVQAKLLRLVQQRRFLRVGGTREETADVRFVCATHRDLEAQVAAGRFRQDLYYRLRVVEIALPALRDRGPADLDRLIDHFVYQFGRRHGRSLHLLPEAREALHAHDWPGNVRELEHCIESAIVLARGDLTPADLRRDDPPMAPASARFATDPRPLADVERDYVRFVVDACGGNRTRAAELLGIGRNTLVRKLRAT